MLLSVLFEVTHWFVLKEHLLLHSQRATEHAAMLGGQPSAAQAHLRKHLRPRTLRLGTVCVLDNVNLLMQDFKDPALSQRLKRSVIRHNHVAAQHQHFVARGWSGGRGRQSKRTISEANILSLETRVNYPLVLPWLQAILGPNLTIRTRTKAVMQSPREEPDKQCAGAGMIHNHFIPTDWRRLK